MSQGVSHFPAGDHRMQGTDKTAWQTLNTINKNNPQKKHRIGKVSTIVLLEGANLSLLSDVNQTNKCLVRVKDP